MTDTVDPFDYMLDYREPTTATADQWALVDSPRSDWTFTWVKYRDMKTGVSVVLYRDGILNIEGGDTDIDAAFIDRLQSLKALARKHFGEEWGEIE